MDKNYFRCWLNEEQKWGWYAESSDDSCSLELISEDSLYTGDVSFYIVEQFIGKYDDNGRKMYEGDIIRTIECTVQGDVEVVGEIEYDYNYCRYLISFPKYGISKDISDFIDMGIEVIGNIHENYELLGVSDGK